MFANSGEITPPWGTPRVPEAFSITPEQLQDLGILNPTRYLAEQQIVPHGVEVGGEIKIDHPRLARHNGLSHPGHRLVRRPLGPIAVRPVAEVRFEDRLHDEFERPLYHPVPNRRDPQHADLAPALRNLDAPVPQRPVGACDQFVPQVRQPPLDAAGLDRRERDPVNTRGPVVLLGDLVGGAKRPRHGSRYPRSARDLVSSRTPRLCRPRSLYAHGPIDESRLSLNTRARGAYRPRARRDVANGGAGMEQFQGGAGGIKRNPSSPPPGGFGRSPPSRDPSQP